MVLAGFLLNAASWKKLSLKAHLKNKPLNDIENFSEIFSKISLEDKKKGLILQPQLRQQEVAGEIGKTKE